MSITKFCSFTPLEKPPTPVGGINNFFRDGGSMTPSLAVREHSSLTGFTEIPI